MGEVSGRITRRTFSTLGLGLGAAALGAPFIRTARAAPPSLKVGVVTSLSGDDIFGGNLTRRGYDLWAETVNKNGGVEIGGQRYPVKMSYGDDQSSPATGAAVAERLIVSDGVDVIFGPYTSGVTLAVQPICQKYQVPMISGSAESPNVWKVKPEYNFGMIPAVDMSAGRSVGVLTDVANPKPQTIAVLGVDEPFSKDTAIGFQKGAPQAGLKVLAFELFPNNADVSPLISKVASLNPDILAVGGHEQALIDTVKAMKSLNYRPKALLMHYGVTDPAYAQALAPDGDGTLGISVWLPSVPYKDDTFGTAKQYDQAAYNRWGSHPDYTEAACSASGVVLSDALKRLGKAPSSPQDRAALKDAIAATDMQTFYGNVKFEKSGDHYHDNVQPVPVLIQVQKGDVVAVGPKSAAQAKIIYPLPSWK